VLSFTVTTESGDVSLVPSHEQDMFLSPMGRGLRHRWTMRNVPALRTEPFMTAPSDFISQISFQIAAVHVPGWGNENLLRSWRNLTTMLVGSDGYYTAALQKDGGVREQAQAVVAAVTTPAERVRALYDFVRRTVVFDGEMGIDVTRGNADVLRDRRGSSAETNLLLVGLLRAAGFDAHPALLSTRDHGRPLPLHPLLDQFNDLVAYVTVDGQGQLLDATDPMRPATLLPSYSLNGQAWVARGVEGTWVPIVARGAARRAINVTATLGLDGTLAGTVTTSDADYAALSLRRALRDMTDEVTFVRDKVLDGLDGLTLTSPTIHDRDVAEKPFTVEAAFSMAGYAQQVGDLLYVMPVAFGRIGENPLHRPTRTFPVDLGHGRDRAYVLDLTLPEGYVLAETPPNRTVQLSSGGASYTRAVRAEGNRVQIRMRFNVTKAVFEPQHYVSLRQFWSDVVALETEPLVLRRAETTSQNGN